VASRTGESFAHTGLSGEVGASLLARSQHVDAAVGAAAQLFFEAVGQARIAIAAVGGYGRQELFPYSDVDLLLLAESEEALKQIKEPVSQLLRVLWDQGLRVSQSVRTVAECCRLHEQNTELHISLLDVRFLCGNETLFGTLTESLPAFYRRYSNAIGRRLSEITKARHAKYNNTIYHLEPNVKETPGTIRDVHLLAWLSVLMPQHEAIRESLTEIRDAKDFLYRLRFFLHGQARRDSNLLTFELQDDAARSLQGGAAPDEWMRSYYQNARRVWQSVSRALEQVDSHDKSLLRHFHDRRSRYSNNDFSVLNDRVYLRNPSEVTQTAASVLALFTFVARHGIRLAWDTQRRLSSQSDAIAAQFSLNPASWTAWSELLNQRHASLALQEMHEAGALSAALPEWKMIDSLVVRDFYHRYTVDEHTLVAIEITDELLAGHAVAEKRFHKLLHEVDDLAVLRFALLLHDLGKGAQMGDHVAGSLTSARLIMKRLNVPANHRRTVEFLIEHHLDLSQVMTGRDLDDPATASYLASRTETLEHLRYLTLLTYADISAVNPTAMTPWRLEQLWRVYVTGQEQLTRELDIDRIEDIQDVPLEERTPDLLQFLEGLPTRYLRTHAHEEIRRHAELGSQAASRGVAVEVTAGKGVFLANVLAPDKPGLFASLCGALASFGMNIVKAEAFTNASGLAVDQFRFTDPLRTLELNPTEIDRLRLTIERVVTGREDVKFLLKRRRSISRSSRAAQISPMLRFNNEASELATLVDFVGEDRPGLLYDLASGFSAAGCNIELVMIDTEAHKAVDVFYVTSEGKKLDEAMQRRLKNSLARAIEPS
jgi:[protein-PII] uridylyltransferase